MWPGAPNQRNATARGPEGPRTPEGTLVIEIRTENAKLGAVHVAPASATRPLGADDEDLLNAFVAAATNTLANAVYFEALQRSEQWLKATIEVTSSLLSLESAEVLATIVRGARRVTGGLAAWILVPHGADQVMFGAADGPGTDGLKGQTIALEHVPVYRQAMSSRTPVVVNDLEPHPSARALIDVDRLMAVPLIAKDRRLGSLLIGSRLADPFRDTDLEMAVTFADHAAMALEFDRFAADRHRLVLLEERNRIARDLHDIVIQRIFAVGIRIARLRPKIPEPTGAVLIECCAELDDTIAELRRAIFSLRTDGDGASLRTQVIRLVEQASASLGFRPDLHLDGPLDIGVPAHVRDHAVATLYEALSNVTKHSDATRVSVTVSLEGRYLAVIVADDGCGLPQDRRRSGLDNLAARADELHGTMTLGVGLDGKGTSLTWRVPIIEP